MRSHTGTPFRQVQITSDNSHLIVPAADKGNRDCVIIYNAKTGILMNKIPVKLPGFKVHKISLISYNFFSIVNYIKNTNFIGYNLYYTYA